MACYTNGLAGEPDVDIATLLASNLGLSYVAWPPPEPQDIDDWQALTRLFVSQTDGLSSLIQIRDYVDQLSGHGPLGVKAGGLGGEIARSAAAAVPYAATVPIVTRSARLQALLLSQPAEQFGDLWTAETLDAARRHVRGFVADRLAEGWLMNSVAEAWYAFERVARWGSSGLRRTSATDDFFTPYCSRAYIRYCFSLDARERYAEVTHRRLLKLMDPSLLAFPFDKPWRVSHSRLAALDASWGLVRTVLDRERRRGKPRGRFDPQRPPYWMRWFDAHAEGHRELCLSTPGSPLWQWIDRAALEHAFAAPPGERAGQREGLARAVTLFWYFHGQGD